MRGDEQAVGVLRAVADFGGRVPDDLAVAAFDGIAHGAFCIPGLTTARQPVHEMGRRAVAALVGPPAEPQTEVLAVELVLRGSCGCADTIGDRAVLTSTGNATIGSSPGRNTGRPARKA